MPTLAVLVLSAMVGVLWGCGGSNADAVAGDAGPVGEDAAVDGGAEPDAIDARIDRLFRDDPSFGDLDRALVRSMMELSEEDDAPFFMCNFVKLREQAAYPDGREIDLTGAEANELYGQMVLPVLEDVGARPVFVARVEMALDGDRDVTWDQIGVVRYPSRAAFFDMLERDDFRAAAIHKVAGVERTLVMPSERVDLGAPDDFLEVDLEAVMFPPTGDDAPIAIVHLYDYRERAQYEDGRDTELTGEEAVQVYSSNRMEQGVLELGVRPGLWLDIQGALIGDGRDFNEFRVNLFPSRAAFFHVAGTSDEAGIEHRYAGLAHWYSMMTEPLINEYGYR